MKALGENLTLEMGGGQEFELKLSDLSEKSQALANNLATDKPETTEPPKEKPTTPEVSGLHEWTNKSGRKIKAEFIKVEGDTLTIKMNDKEFGLKLASLSEQSKVLAKSLAEPAEKPKTDPKDEEEDQERIAHYLELGGADRGEIEESIDAAKNYFVAMDF